MQRARRRDPMPWTAELGVLAVVVSLLGLALGAQLGRTLANALAGAGWTWPVDQAAFWRSLVQVLQGDAAAGLPRPLPTGLADTLLVQGCIIVTELLVLGCLLAAAGLIYQRWGPGRVHGMADTGEVRRVLGQARLRQVSHVVRPDLYARTPAAGARAATGDWAVSAQQRPAEAVGLGRRLSPRFLPDRDRGPR